MASVFDKKRLERIIIFRGSSTADTDSLDAARMARFLCPLECTLFKPEARFERW